MPTLLTQAPAIPVSPNPSRKRWTREQCAVLESSGLFNKERLELVDGDLLCKMGKNRPHVNSFMLMLFWLVETFGKQFVNAAAPIDVSPEDNPSNEPEPDLIVLNRECLTFLAANPQPDDIRLLVEISDSSLDYDLTVKARLYARAGVSEYWVVDVTGKRLYCHRNPVAGSYESVTIYNEHESVSPLAAPKSDFRPAQAFPA